MLGALMARGLLATGLVGLATALAEVIEPPQARYGLIIDRNAFGLSDPPPPAPPQAPPPAPPPAQLNLQLAGISVGPEGKFAWLVAPPKPGQNTNTLYLKLREWSPQNPDEQDDVKVLSINTQDRTVRVENAGVVAVLELDKDSPAPQGPAVVPGAPGAPAAGARPGTRPAARQVPAPGAAGARVVPPPAGGATLPSAAVRQVGTTTTPTRQATATLGAGGSQGYTTTPGGRVVPARPVRSAPEEQGVRDPAMQWLMLRAQEQAAQSQGVPFPPTPPVPGVE
jgi:hypothetical protein